MSTQFLTPTEIAAAARCMYRWHLECHGDPAERTAPSASVQHRWEQGRVFECQARKQLPEAVEPQWDGKDWAAGIAATEALMRQGVKWIYHAVLAQGDMRGVVDFLKRVDDRSALGTHTYMPVDAKNHKTVDLRDKYQLLAYSAMLEPILGQRPAEGGVWLNTGSVTLVDLAALQATFDAHIAAMLQVRSGQLTPHSLRCSECAECLWHNYCARQWAKTHSVCLVCGVNAKSAQKLLAAGYSTYDALAAEDPQVLARALRWKEAAARDKCLNARARVEGRAIPRGPVSWPEGVPVICYDIETHGGKVYLHGLVRLSGQEREERSFLARTGQQEADVWREFLDYMAGCEQAVVYTWTDYERPFAEKLWETYGGNPDGWRILQAGMTDMKEFVKQHYALPVSTYSIKEVAPVFGFRWQAEDAGGANSERWYDDWLHSGDEALLEKIRQYNLDDVRAMETVMFTMQVSDP